MPYLVQVMREYTSKVDILMEEKKKRDGEEKKEEGNAEGGEGNNPFLQVSIFLICLFFISLFDFLLIFFFFRCNSNK